MTKTKYLYDVSPIKFKHLTYIDALEFKISSAKKLLNDLLDVNIYARDDIRVKKVFRAIKFNEDLIKEMEE